LLVLFFILSYRVPLVKGQKSKKSNRFVQTAQKARGIFGGRKTASRATND
jgi:hypothetical protein